jgi:hypothetical protein
MQERGKKVHNTLERAHSLSGMCPQALVGRYCTVRAMVLFAVADPEVPVMVMV